MPGLPAVEDVVEHAGAAGLGHELGAEADQAAGRDPVVHPDPAGAVVDHLDQRALAQGHQLGHHAEVVVGDIDGHPLHRLVELAVDLPGDDLGLAHGELEAFAAHGLDQDGQLQLAAALDLPGVGPLGGPTRSDTLPMSSASSRLSTWRAVSLLPSVPASGEVLMPMVMARLGSSTVMTAGRRGRRRRPGSRRW